MIEMRKTHGRTAMSHAHVVWNPTGGWDVIHKRDEPILHYSNRLEAVNSARARLDSRGGGLIVVHGRISCGPQLPGMDAA
jgi:hypothetical protein